MKLVKPQHNQPKNVVEFHVSMEMTKIDVKNYLEKIYNVYPVYVNTRIALGKTHMPEKFVVKEDDIKIAYVVLVSIRKKIYIFNKNIFDIIQYILYNII